MIQINSRRKFALPILAAVTVLLLTACSGGDSAPDGDAPTSGGTLRVAASQGALTCIDPQQVVVPEGRAVSRAVTDSLLYQDPKTLEVKPWLAESWESNEDATQYTLHLKEGVTFSDGTPFNAEVVQKNLDAIVNVLGPKAVRGIFFLTDYDSTEVVDDLTAIIKFKAPTASFPIAATTPAFSMVSVATTEIDPADRCAGEIVGTGPFIVDSYQEGQSVELLKRAGYTTPPPGSSNQGDAYLDGISIQVVSAPSVRAGSVITDQVDVAQGILEEDVDTLGAAQVTLIDVKRPGAPLHAFINASSDGPTSDPAVRKAVRYAIDRQAIVDTALGRYYSPSTGVLSSSTFAQANFSADLKFDRKQAEKILNDAGWVPGDDGIREKDGQRLSFGLMYTTDYGAFYTTYAQLVQQQLQDVGIEIELENLTPGTMIPRLFSFEYDMNLNSFTDTEPGFVPALVRTLVAPEVLEQTDYLELLAASNAAADVDERVSALEEVQKVIFDEGWIVPIADAGEVMAYKSNVHGLRFEPGAVAYYYEISLS